MTSAAVVAAAPSSAGHGARGRPGRPAPAAAGAAGRSPRSTGEAPRAERGGRLRPPRAGGRPGGQDDRAVRVAREPRGRGLAVGCGGPARESTGRRLGGRGGAAGSGLRRRGAGGGPAARPGAGRATGPRPGQRPGEVGGSGTTGAGAGARGRPGRLAGSRGRRPGGAGPPAVAGPGGPAGGGRGRWGPGGPGRAGGGGPRRVRGGSGRRPGGRTRGGPGGGRGGRRPCALRRRSLRSSAWGSTGPARSAVDRGCAVGVGRVHRVCSSRDQGSVGSVGRPAGPSSARAPPAPAAPGPAVAAGRPHPARDPHARQDHQHDGCGRGQPHRDRAVGGRSQQQTSRGTEGFTPRCPRLGVARRTGPARVTSTPTWTWRLPNGGTGDRPAGASPQARRRASSTWTRTATGSRFSTVTSSGRVVGAQRVGAGRLHARAPWSAAVGLASPSRPRAAPRRPDRRATPPTGCAAGPRSAVRRSPTARGSRAPSCSVAARRSRWRSRDRARRGPPRPRRARVPRRTRRSAARRGRGRGAVAARPSRLAEVDRAHEPAAG